MIAAGGALCSCGASLAQPANGASEVVACECGKLWAIRVYSGRALVTAYDGDVDAAMRRLTLLRGAQVARERFPNDPDRERAYVALWRETVRARASQAPRTRRLTGAIAVALQDRYRGGHRWLRPVLHAYSWLLWKMRGGMPPRLRRFIDRAFATRHTSED